MKILAARRDRRSRRYGATAIGVAHGPPDLHEFSEDFGLHILARAAAGIPDFDSDGRFNTISRKEGDGQSA